MLTQSDGEGWDRKKGWSARHQSLPPSRLPSSHSSSFPSSASQVAQCARLVDDAGVTQEGDAGELVVQSGDAGDAAAVGEVDVLPGRALVIRGEDQAADHGGGVPEVHSESSVTFTLPY